MRTNDILNEHFRKEFKQQILWEEQERKKRDILLKSMDKRRQAKDRKKLNLTELNMSSKTSPSLESFRHRKANNKNSLPDNNRYIGWGIGDVSPKYKNMEHSFKSVYGLQEKSSHGKKAIMSSEFFDRDGVMCLSPRGRAHKPIIKSM